MAIKWQGPQVLSERGLLKVMVHQFSAASHELVEWPWGTQPLSFSFFVYKIRYLEESGLKKMTCMASMVPSTE